MTKIDKRPKSKFPELEETAATSTFKVIKVSHGWVTYPEV